MKKIAPLAMAVFIFLNVLSIVIILIVLALYLSEWNKLLFIPLGIGLLLFIISLTGIISCKMIKRKY